MQVYLSLPLPIQPDRFFSTSPISMGVQPGQKQVWELCWVAAGLPVPLPEVYQSL